jgi:hypothetical protein
MNKYFLFRLQVEYVMPFINKYIIKIKLHDHHFIKLEAHLLIMQWGFQVTLWFLRNIIYILGFF